jgi:hypothetical protein
MENLVAKMKIVNQINVLNRKKYVPESPKMRNVEAKMNAPLILCAYKIYARSKKKKARTVLMIVSAKTAFFVKINASSIIRKN